MALSEVTICNLALAYMGITRQLEDAGDGLIASVTKTSDNVRMCQLFYEPARDAVLSDFPWPFATKFVLLTLASDGTGEVWEGEWDNAYDYPADCLVVRKFLTTGLTVANPWAWWGTTHHDAISPPFAIRVFNGAQCIFTDVQEDLANIEYTAKITDATLYPVRFGMALARRLAFEISTALRVTPEIARAALQLYQLEIDAARRSLANEDDPREPPDGDFLQARGS